MAGLYTIKVKGSSTEVDVYAVRPQTLGGVDQCMFYVWDLRVGRFRWVPSSFFEPAAGSGYEPPIPVESIKFMQNGTEVRTLSVEKGKTETVDIEIIPANATVNIDYASKNESIATISVSGTTATITGIDRGSTEITANSQNGIGADLAINVTPETVAVTGVTFITNAFTLAINETYQLSHTVAPNNATNQTVIYTNLNDDIIRATEQGSGILIRGLSAGVGTIRITTVDGGHTDDCVITVTPNSRTVVNSDQIHAALADSTVGEIIIGGPFELTELTAINRPLTMKGNGNTLTYTPANEKDGITIIGTTNVILENMKITMLQNAEGWQGDYGCQVYNSDNVVLNSCVFTGADGGILVNSSIVTLDESVDVGGNAFGGIEVSEGQNGAHSPTLNINNATLINNTESYGKPTIWIDGTGTVTGADDLFMITKDGQKQYYTQEQNSVEPE